MSSFNCQRCQSVGRGDLLLSPKMLMALQAEVLAKMILEWMPKMSAKIQTDLLAVVMLV